MNNESFNEKKCNSCGSELTIINFSAKMTEQWAWNGYTWECVTQNTLINDHAQDVRCPECDSVVGTGKDFGF